METDTIDEDWESTLAHRNSSERPGLVRRFQNAGITRENLLHTFADLGDSLFNARPSPTKQERTLRELEKEAIILAELGAYLRYATERTAYMRSTNLSVLLEHFSLTQIASALGVSRQAIHKSAKSDRLNGPYARTITHQPEEER